MEENSIKITKSFLRKGGIILTPEEEEKIKEILFSKNIELELVDTVEYSNSSSFYAYDGDLIEYEDKFIITLTMFNDKDQTRVEAKILAMDKDFNLINEYDVKDTNNNYTAIGPASSYRYVFKDDLKTPSTKNYILNNKLYVFYHYVKCLGTKQITVYFKMLTFDLATFSLESNNLIDSYSVTSQNNLTESLTKSWHIKYIFNCDDSIYCICGSYNGTQSRTNYLIKIDLNNNYAITKYSFDTKEDLFDYRHCFNFKKNDGIVFEKKEELIKIYLPYGIITFNTINNSIDYFNYSTIDQSLKNFSDYISSISNPVSAVNLLDFYYGEDKNLFLLWSTKSYYIMTFYIVEYDKNNDSWNLKEIDNIPLYWNDYIFSTNSSGAKTVKNNNNLTCNYYIGGIRDGVINNNCFYISCIARMMDSPSSRKEKLVTINYDFINENFSFNDERKILGPDAYALDYRSIRIISKMIYENDQNIIFLGRTRNSPLLKLFYFDKDLSSLCPGNEEELNIEIGKNIVTTVKRGSCISFVKNDELYLIFFKPESFTYPDTPKFMIYKIKDKEEK